MNGRDQPSIGAEVVRELAPRNRSICSRAFIKWHGVRLLEAPLRALCERGRPASASSRRPTWARPIGRALDALLELGAEIKVSYDVRTTRLHAKAWLFHRGRSDDRVCRLVQSLADGADGWSRVERPSVGGRAAPPRGHVRGHLRRLLERPGVRDIHARPMRAFDAEIAAARGASRRASSEISPLDVRPYPIRPRSSSDSTPSATSTTGGATWSSWPPARERRWSPHSTTADCVPRAGWTASCSSRTARRSCEQSLRTFREGHARREPSAKLVRRTGDGRTNGVTSSRRSSRSRTSTSATRPAITFSMVVVDEFHHAEAATYERLLRACGPGGPPRSDRDPRAHRRRSDVTRWFDGRIAVELRLWEALERSLLSPFQYFGVADDVDLSGVTWKRGRLRHRASSTALYAGNDGRAAKIVEAVTRTVADVGCDAGARLLRERRPRTVHGGSIPGCRDSGRRASRRTRRPRSVATP